MQTLPLFLFLSFLGRGTWPSHKHYHGLLVLNLVIFTFGRCLVPRERPTSITVLVTTPVFAAPILSGSAKKLDDQGNKVIFNQVSMARGMTHGKTIATDPWTWTRGSGPSGDRNRAVTTS